MQEMWVLSLGWEDPLKEEMSITPVFLPGKSHIQMYRGAWQAAIYKVKKESDMIKQ